MIMMRSVLLVALVGCCAVAAAAAYNPNLRFFSVWQLNAVAPAIARGWTSGMITSTNLTEILEWYDAGVGPSLLSVLWVLFEAGGLRPDWIESWAVAFAELQPHLLAGRVAGVFLGDELAWNCIPYSNITAAADLVRASIPRGQGIIYYNEAWPPFAADGQRLWRHMCAHVELLEYPRVPASLDWFSIDYYPDEGTFAGAVKLVRQSVYPLMSAEQSLVLVPPAYGAGNASLSSLLCCAAHTRDGPNVDCHAVCATAMLEWALAAYDWARTDSRIVGIAPWRMDGAPVVDNQCTTVYACNASFAPGLVYMPDVLDVYRSIGAEIVRGTQADIDVSNQFHRG